MGSLQWALSWLVMLAAGLAPMLVYWVAGLIGQAFRRKRGVCGGVARRSLPEGAERSRQHEAAPPW